jgi:predicted amidohydrolase
VNVAGVQFGTAYDKEANVAKALGYLDSMVGNGPDLICLPELFTLRRVERMRDRLGEYAETIPGPLTKALGERARRLGAYLVAGSFLEQGEDGRFYNTSPIFDPSGQITATYRKTHLFDAPGGHSESSVITPGNGLVTFDTPFGRVGVLICYDIRFPEVARTLALAGATILCVPNSWPIDGLSPGSDQLRILLQATALQNLTYLLHANQFGVIDGDLALCGRSSVVDPWGEVTAQAPDQEGVMRSTLDLSYLHRIRETRMTYRHRRPHLYRLTEGGTE